MGDSFSFFLAHNLFFLAVHQVGSVPDPRAAALRIIDIQSVGFSDVGGLVGEYFRKISSLNSRYPERVWRTLVVNVPASFAMVWRLVEPRLEPSVRAKITLFRGASYRDDLMQLVAATELPERYGGTLKAATTAEAKGVRLNGQEAARALLGGGGGGGSSSGGGGGCDGDSDTFEDSWANAPDSSTEGGDLGLSRPWLTYPMEKRLRRAAKEGAQGVAKGTAKRATAQSGAEGGAEGGAEVGARLADRFDRAATPVPGSDGGSGTVRPGFTV